MAEELVWYHHGIAGSPLFPVIIDLVSNVTYSLTVFSCLQSLPASGSFPKSQLFPGGQSIRASISVLPVNI